MTCWNALTLKTMRFVSVYCTHHILTQICSMNTVLRDRLKKLIEAFLKRKTYVKELEMVVLKLKVC